jgi:hypothetical protein
MRRFQLVCGLLLCHACADQKIAERSSAISETYDYVFSSLTIDANDASPAAGFNLDGLYSGPGSSGGCSVVDRACDLDLDQNLGGCTPCSGPGCSPCQGGVDNALPRLAADFDAWLGGMGAPGAALATTTRERLAQELAGGHVVFLLRVEGVDNLSNDSDVIVSLYRGYATDSSCSAMFGGSGHFVVSNESLLVPGDLAQARWRVHGAIVSGRLRVRYGTQSQLAAEAPADFPINQLTLRATFDPGGGSASAGNAGGWIGATALRDLVVASLPRIRSALNGRLPLVSDLPSLSTPPVCGGAYAQPVGGVGLGARFNLAHANITGSASVPPAGACGS